MEKDPQNKEVNIDSNLENENLEISQEIKSKNSNSTTCEYDNWSSE